jgi:hypothetical protein
MTIDLKSIYGRFDISVLIFYINNHRVWLCMRATPLNPFEPAINLDDFQAE